MTLQEYLKKEIILTKIVLENENNTYDKEYFTGQLHILEKIQKNIEKLIDL